MKEVGVSSNVLSWFVCRYQSALCLGAKG